MKFLNQVLEGSNLSINLDIGGDDHWIKTAEKKYDLKIKRGPADSDSGTAVGTKSNLSSFLKDIGYSDAEKTFPELFESGRDRITSNDAKAYIKKRYPKLVNDITVNSGYIGLEDMSFDSITYKGKIIKCGTGYHRGFGDNSMNKSTFIDELKSIANGLYESAKFGKEGTLMFYSDEPEVLLDIQDVIKKSLKAGSINPQGKERIIKLLQAL